MTQITCIDCNKEFEHQAARGRPPVRCPEHRAKPLTRKVANPRTRTVPVPNISPPTVRRPRAGTVLLVCGACGSAPRDVNRSAAHKRCRWDRCECSLLNHQPDDRVRGYQSRYNDLTPEECALRDPGL